MYVRSMLLTLNVLTVHQIQNAIYRIKVNEKKRRKKTPPHVDALSSFPLAICSVRLSAYGCYGTVTYVWHPPPPVLFSKFCPKIGSWIVLPHGLPETQ